MWVACPYLKTDVELTDERRQHIAEMHPDLLPDHLDLIAQTLAGPEQVRRDVRFPSTRIFSRWHNELLGGKYVAVAVVSPVAPSPPQAARHWIVTAYIADRITQGRIEWTKS